MESNTAVKIKNVSMRFRLNNEKVDSVKEYFIRLIKRKLTYRTFFALKDIDVEIAKGEVFGIIGLNGSGKSTLLKLISGIYKPTYGKVSVCGTISPLIELGAGFEDELTARENIYLNGSILGYSKKFISDLFDEIVNFAELRAFLDVPIKNFSSGMRARLGFSIATAVKPDILIVDEILSVGDFKFQEKSERRIEELFGGDTTVIIVSHTLEQIERLCTRVLWLADGKNVMLGKAEQVCKAYRAQQRSAVDSD
ncbi:MAG: ABC transporter ATP-binding protein [Oscillospiraceae bacterium]|nr:ABC transporter ATP-binding protein [Oscillospiraceae bacterium]